VELRLGSARLLTVLYVDILIANPLIPKWSSYR